MADRGLFRGHALQGIDAKGRVAIPASLRSVIERNAGEKLLLLSLHAEDGCLTGGDTGLSQIDYERSQREEARALESGREFDREATARATFGMTEELPFDASGRFILPPFFRDAAKLGDSAFFVGTGERFEIWNPQIALGSDRVPAPVKQVVTYLQSQRGLG